MLKFFIFMMIFLLSEKSFSCSCSRFQYYIGVPEGTELYKIPETTSGFGQVYSKENEKFVKFFSCKNRSPCSDLRITHLGYDFKDGDIVYLMSAFKSFEDAIRFDFVKGIEADQLNKSFRFWDILDSCSCPTLKSVSILAFIPRSPKLFHFESQLTECGCTQDNFEEWKKESWDVAGRFRSENGKVFFSSGNEKVLFEVESGDKCNPMARFPHKIILPKSIKDKIQNKKIKEFNFCKIPFFIHSPMRSMQPF